MRVKLVPEHNKIAAAPIAGSKVLFAFPEHAPRVTRFPARKSAASPLPGGRAKQVVGRLVGLEAGAAPGHSTALVGRRHAFDVLVPR
jgi:hypothetical protein